MVAVDKSPRFTAFWAARGGSLSGLRTSKNWLLNGSGSGDAGDIWTPAMTKAVANLPPTRSRRRPTRSSTAPRRRSPARAACQRRRHGPSWSPTASRWCSGPPTTTLLRGRTSARRATGSWVAPATSTTRRARGPVRSRLRPRRRDRSSGRRRRTDRRRLCRVRRVRGAERLHVAPGHRGGAAGRSATDAGAAHLRHAPVDGPPQPGPVGRQPRRPAAGPRRDDGRQPVAAPGAADGVRGVLQRLFEFPGVFVFGSNDYFAPSPVNPLRYLGMARRTQAAARGAPPP
jgi:hypothetical protein